MDTQTIRERMLARAFLFDSPSSYAAGVEAVLVALEATQPLEEAGPPLRRHG